MAKRGHEITVYFGDTKCLRFMKTIFYGSLYFFKAKSNSIEVREIHSIKKKNPKKTINHLLSSVYHLHLRILILYFSIVFMYLKIMIVCQIENKNKKQIFLL